MLFAFSGINYFSFASPLLYAYDGIFSLGIVKGILENHSIWVNPHLGFPNGYIGYDFPMTESFHVLLIMLLGAIFGHDPIIITNLFYLLSFALAALTSLWVLRYYKISYPLALAGAMVFTFLPYHFYRSTMHLFLSSYFTIPLWCAVITTIYQNGRSKLHSNNILNILFILLLSYVLSSTGIYYTFFGCFFLICAAIIAWSEKRTSAAIFSLIMIALAVFFVILQLAPSILYHAQYGANPLAAVRSSAQTEIYGLRIAHLLLSPEYERISFLANISNRYNQIFVSGLNESIYSHLGLISSCGFILLLLMIFIPRKFPDNTQLKLISKLNLLAVLFATTSGFAVLFSFFVTDMIRSVNRISIFIAFFAIFMVLYLLQCVISKFKIHIIVYWLISIGVLYLAAIDQIDSSSFDNRKNIMPAASDKYFVSDIEQTLPKGSAVFQLPYMDFPEPRIISGTMGTYEPMSLYLYSRDLYWSYGATRGRDVDKWDKTTTALPVKAMLAKLKPAGYSGIVIDTYGYQDKGQSIIHELNHELGKSPLISLDHHYVFYSLGSK
jgi:phosphoglycerol transferase